MNMFTTATVLIIITLHDVVMSSREKPLHSIVAKQDITDDQVQCIIRTLTPQLDDNATCANVADQLGSLYFSPDVVQSLSTQLSLFPELCRPSCGQVLIDAWQACNAYNEIEDVANLLIAMCASNGNVACYSNFIQLFQYVYDGVDCYNFEIVDGTCSTGCSSRIAEGIERYGCCVNAAIDYIEAIDDVKDEVAQLFSTCDVNRPARCTNSPLSSAHHTVAVALNICIITILAAWELI